MRLRLGTAANSSFRWLAVLFPFSIIGSVLAQGYLVPPPGYQGAPAVPAMGNVSGTGIDTQSRNNQQNLETLTAVPDESTGQTEGPAVVQPNRQVAGQANPKTGASQNTEGEATGAASAPLTAPMTSLMSWGALHLHVQASYQFLYATGIHNGPGNSVDTVTHTFTPAMTLQLGPHATLAYAPSLRIYSKKDFHNTIDHSLSLTGGARYGDWTFGTSHGLGISDDPLVETSAQTRQVDYTGRVFGSYKVNDKVSLMTSAGANLIFVGTTNTVFTNGVGGTSELRDSQSVFGNESLNYNFDEKISGGVGVTITYAQQDHGFRSVDEQYDGHLSWHPGEKLTASAMAGIERRHFLNLGEATDWNPIYGADVAYHVFEHTTLSLYANRTVGSSLFQSIVTEDTAVGIAFQQRLLGKLQLSLGFGYTKSDYILTTSNLSASRTDEGTSYSAGLSLPFLTRCNLSSFYQYSENTSSSNGFGYSSSQVGVSVSWAY
jgi:hypothetical protein